VYKISVNAAQLISKLHFASFFVFTNIAVATAAARALTKASF